ncbi:MAG: pyridoxal phosphate-dependent aminotransferase family protein [Spirochaetota bacterium]
MPNDFPRQTLGPFTNLARSVDGDLDSYVSANYFALTTDKGVVAKTISAIENYGTSLLTGHASFQIPEHSLLEEVLAEICQQETCCITSSGYTANLVALSVLASSSRDLVIFDEHIHHSIRAGAQLAGATTDFFPHNDCEALKSKLATVRSQYRRVIIATEGVYSAEGTFGNVVGLSELAIQYDCTLLIDECHSLGIAAPGRGILGKVPIPATTRTLIIGSLGKSFASSGGLVAGPSKLINKIRSRSPIFLLTTGLTPATIVSALAAATKIKNDHNLHEQLSERIALFCELADTHELPLAESKTNTPIFTVPVGKVVESWSTLVKKGFLVQGLGFPAVPRNSERIRIMLNVAHTKKQITHLVEAIASLPTLAYKN